MSTRYGRNVIMITSFDDPGKKKALSHLHQRARSLLFTAHMQTRLMGQYIGKWPISLIYVLKPLITAITAIASDDIVPFGLLTPYQKPPAFLSGENTCQI